MHTYVYGNFWKDPTQVNYFGLYQEDEMGVRIYVLYPTVV